MSRATIIEPQNEGEAPLAYTLAVGQTIETLAVAADFDGSGAAGDFLPTLSMYAQDGRRLGTFSAQTTVVAGNSEQVTFFPFAPPASSGGAGITEIDNSDGSVLVGGGPFGPIVDLSTFRPQFSQNIGSVTFVAPGAANVPWTFFLGDNFLDYTTPTTPTPLTAGWYAFSAFATFGPLAAGGASGDGTLTASGGYAPSPSSEAGGFGTDTFGLALAWSIPPLRMKTTGSVVLGVDTDSATGCTVNAQLNVAWLRPD